VNALALAVADQLDAALRATGALTDTGGSVRAPASINNLVGIRPTVGLVSRTGMAPLDSQRDTPGPMGRTVADVARVLDVIAELRDAPTEKRVHPLHAARIAEVAAVTVSPDDDPQTIQGRKDEQQYRDAFTAAMELAGVEALVFPVWSFPPVLNGDRGQTPQGALTFVGSATQWPVAVVPMGFVGERSSEQLPMGMQLLGQPWSESRLIQFACAYEQATPHRRPPPSVPPLHPDATRA
jgi:Asp-tRNA(Asn)/Glu-tRNA(Gln) amidotransferase A subunit family amidase